MKATTTQIAALQLFINHYCTQFTSNTRKLPLKVIQDYPQIASISFLWNTPIDITLSKSLITKLTKREVQSVILHELGHAVSGKYITLAEKMQFFAGQINYAISDAYADDFAVHCGFGKELCSALPKVSKLSDDPDHPLIQRQWKARVKRIMTLYPSQC